MKIDTDSQKRFPVVGIGASGGGLYAFQCFLTPLPVDFCFALVFVRHPSSRHNSLVADLLRSGRPDLEVIEINDGLKIKPGQIYLCPPAQDIVLRQGVFRVTSPAEEHLHLPIDTFFTSLAEEGGEDAVGVILSGSGSDGVRGIRKIRNHGGKVFVQDPVTAEAPSLPLAAIGTHCADAVMPAGEIAGKILKLCALAAPPVSDPDPTPDEFEILFRLIREKAGQNFTQYKKNVVARRVKRRMSLRSVLTVSEYLQTIAEEEGEAAALASDLMIGVTSFFRDRLAWKALRIGIVRKLATDGESDPIRIWTPACATGEEAYSVAMLFADELVRAGSKRQLQVFATDLNEQALKKARAGCYPVGIVAEMEPEYRNRFFVESDDGQSLVVAKEIRDRLIFAGHDLLTDPPFSHLDLIICRNLLIYLEPTAQDTCFALFHYALREGGYLFLGNAESTGRNTTLFKSLAHKSCRIYQKISGQAATRLPRTVPFAAERPGPLPSWNPSAELEQPAEFIGFVQEKLLEEYAPAAVAIDQNYEIIYHNGATSHYLKQPRGAPTRNLLKLLPANLRNRVRAGIYRASREEKTVSLQASLIQNESRKRQITFRFSKIRDNLFLLVFHDKKAMPAQTFAVPLETARVDENALHQLENELAATRAELQSRIEQFKGLNEEMQTSNEELQAANEELQTSREELQSLNEELITVNAQLQAKIKEQEDTNNDLNNFLTSTSIPTLFLDQHFRLRRFTTTMAKLLKFLPSDVGRPIKDMSQDGLGPDLIADARSVLDHLAPVRREIAVNSSWYIRAVLPFRTAENRIDGVVVTYTDVSELKAAEERTRHLASFPQVNPNPVLEVASSGRVTYFNPGTRAVLAALGMDKDNITAFLPQDMEAILQHLNNKENMTMYREVSLGDKAFAATVHLVPQFDVVRIYALDITERRQAEREMKKLNQDLNNNVIQLEATNRELEAFSSSVSHDLRAPLRTITGFSQILLDDYGSRLDEEGLDSLERIVAGALRMGQLIDDLLKLSRLTRMEMIRTRINLSRLAENIVTTLASSEPERRVRWIVHPDIFAEGDGRLLNQLLDNLLRNAFKFTAKKQDAIIEFSVTEQDGERLYFVKDNGVGFDMTYSDKLFQPFQRLHAMKDFPGTGIGLATVKRIINRHGGRTWIQGEPGKGAIAYFTLGEYIGGQRAG